MTRLRNPAIVAGFSLLLAACSLLERDLEPRGMTDSGYRLSRMMWSDGMVAQFGYDGDNRIQRIDYGRGSFTTGEITAAADYYEYKYRLGRLFRIYYRCLCSKDASYTDYLYNDKGQVDRRLDRTPNGSFMAMSVYRYDGYGHLAEARDSTTQEVTQRIFFYDANDNPGSMARYRYRSGAVVKDRLEWRSYDSMRSYLQLPALPIDDPNLSRLGNAISWAGNNFLNERRYLEVAGDQPLNLFTSYTRSFEYNAQGLPVLMRTQGMQLKFTYEKY